MLSDVSKKQAFKTSRTTRQTTVTFHNLCVQQHRCGNIEPRVPPCRLTFSTTAIKQNISIIFTVQKKFQQNVKLSGANIDVHAVPVTTLSSPFSLYHAVCNFETSRYIYIYIYIYMSHINTFTPFIDGRKCTDCSSV